MRSVAVDVGGPSRSRSRRTRLTDAELLAPADEMLGAAVARACSAAGIDEDAIVAVGVGLAGGGRPRERLPHLHRGHAGLAPARGRRVARRAPRCAGAARNDANLAAVAERFAGAGGRPAASRSSSSRTASASRSTSAASCTPAPRAPRRDRLPDRRRCRDRRSRAPGVMRSMRWPRSSTWSTRRPSRRPSVPSCAGGPRRHRAAAALAVADPALVVLHGPTGIAAGHPSPLRPRAGCGTTRAGSPRSSRRRSGRPRARGRATPPDGPRARHHAGGRRPPRTVRPQRIESVQP